MRYLHPALPSVIATLVIAVFALQGCDKESGTEQYKRLYPIPTELPEATCTGANTVGAYFDTILFVANYAPNNSSWGSATPPDGVRAWINFKYLNIVKVLGKLPRKTLQDRFETHDLTFLQT